MCKAFRDFKRECILEGKRLGIDEGIAIGEERGIAIGEEKALRSFIKNLLDKSFGLFDICVLTGASEEMVKEEIALAVQH